MFFYRIIRLPCCTLSSVIVELCLKGMEAAVVHIIRFVLDSVSIANLKTRHVIRSALCGLQKGSFDGT